MIELDEKVTIISESQTFVNKCELTLAVEEAVQMKRSIAIANEAVNGLEKR